MTLEVFLAALAATTVLAPLLLGLDYVTQRVNYNAGLKERAMETLAIMEREGVAALLDREPPPAWQWEPFATTPLLCDLANAVTGRGVK